MILRVGCDAPALLSHLTLTLTLSHRGRRDTAALPLWVDVPSAEAPACAGMT